MKIAVIVHSKTGKTLNAGNVFAAKLREKGHFVDVVELKTDPPVNSGTVRSHPPFSITNLPDAGDYDALLVGGPVWAFTASPVIYEAIRGLKDITGKKVVPFVTQGFPLASLGGKQAIGLMSKELSAKGAKVLPGKIIGSVKQNQLIGDAASDLVSLLC